MPLNGSAPVRIARPSRDLAAAERFWTRGLGLEVLFRKEAAAAEDGPGAEYGLLMLGWRDAGWHLELADCPDDPVRPSPTDEDLLVVYLDGPVSPELLRALEENGGKRVAARNAYWDTWGVTVEDPDGYRLVLCTRQWSNAGE
ncbi:VOC family protein [Streptomyces daliensis]|uniref:VOC family protein n=1 Tax=Streptomyces daliensis TaxID=299421 RepID=A0A8T4IZ25_9ACTN|nr:VOC family protein [Streptomyces daliensis]